MCYKIIKPGGGGVIIMATKSDASIQVSRRAPGRPQNFDTEDVLGRALEVFWKQGYGATTTRQLESALELKQSSIYNTFGSKRGLLDAALDRYEALTEVELLRPLEQSNGGLAAIESFFITLHHWITHEGRRGCMLINMMAEDGGKTEAFTERTRNYRSRVRSAFHKTLSQSNEKGEMTDGNIDSRSDLLVNLVLGLNIAARGGLEEAELSQLLDAARQQIRSWRLVPT